MSSEVYKLDNRNRKNIKQLSFLLESRFPISIFKDICLELLCIRLCYTVLLFLQGKYNNTGVCNPEEPARN